MNRASHLEHSRSDTSDAHVPQPWRSTSQAAASIELGPAKRLSEIVISASIQQMIAVAISAKNPHSASSLDQIFGPAFRAFGFDYFYPIEIEKSFPEITISIKCGVRHIKWENYYNLRNYTAFDPIISEIMRSHEACFWSELPQKRGRLTPAERLVLDDAAKFGLTQGYFLPVHSSDGNNAGVVLAGRDIDADNPETRRAADILASSYLGKVRHLRAVRPAPSGRARLTLRSRQVECLRWVAAGKTSAEIAMVLGLSRKTVDEHVENACRSFGVNGRMQAVVRAIQLGLIPPS